ncbi:MAG: Gfo/Idh/MocA family protein [Janthinobacterium lividum]
MPNYQPMAKPIGIGIIGTGAVAQARHLPAFQKLQDEGKVRLVALCDVNPEKLQPLSEQFGILHTFTDYRQMLALDTIDAVAVCTPNYLHKQPVLDAFAAGKHVLCEKPLAINAVEGAEMVATGQAAGRQFQVGYNLRFGPGAQAVRRFVDDGRLGEIYHARALALRRRGIPSHGNFTNKAKQGGGPLIDIGAHVLDLTLWLMDFPKPVSVSGQTQVKFGHREGVIGLRGQWDTKNFTVEDFAAGFIRFENGATLVLESSFAANIAQDQFQTTLMGTEGGAFVDMANEANTRLFREESGTLTDTAPVFLPQVHTHEVEIRAFVQALTDDTPVLVPGEQALTVTRILDALYQSAETGREVLM